MKILCRALKEEQEFFYGAGTSFADRRMLIDIQNSRDSIQPIEITWDLSFAGSNFGGGGDFRGTIEVYSEGECVADPYMYISPNLFNQSFLGTGSVAGSKVINVEPGRSQL